ncbi:hypothetical protein GALL_458930 [mine drainage metagenome]|uniref:Uncharacterized protein n=1 Tax=mine drainage metagenome TaxID=410659 RepID=A0A1J5PMV8_9ZZZZ
MAAMRRRHPLRACGSVSRIIGASTSTPSVSPAYQVTQLGTVSTIGSPRSAYKVSVATVAETRQASGPVRRRKRAASTAPASGTESSVNGLARRAPSNACASAPLAMTAAARSAVPVSPPPKALPANCSSAEANAASHKPGQMRALHRTSATRASPAGSHKDVPWSGGTASRMERRPRAK